MHFSLDINLSVV